jgi:hypothetical protein
MKFPVWLENMALQCGEPFGQAAPHRIETTWLKPNLPA